MVIVHGDARVAFLAVVASGRLVDRASVAPMNRHNNRSAGCVDRVHDQVRLERLPVLV